MINGSIIRDVRHEKGMSALDLSRFVTKYTGVSISKSYIEEIERGTKINPSFIKVVALADALGLDLNLLRINKAS